MLRLSMSDSVSALEQAYRCGTVAFLVDKSAPSQLKNNQEIEWVGSDDGPANHRNLNLRIARA
jgi:hypothetical protein